MSISGGIDLRHIRYFLAVSEELHFGRAARRLHVSQPPLSAAIRKLENELGVRLLDRSSRSVTLTDAGRAFADEGRKLLAALQTAVDETRRIAGAGRGVRRRLGCVPALPVERVLEYVEALRHRHPEDEVQMSNEITLGLVKLLRRGEIDLAIIFDPGDDAGLRTEPLFRGEPLALYAHSDHRLGAKEIVEPGDVRTETLVTGRRATHPTLYDQTLAAVERAGYRFETIVEVPGPTWPDVEIAVASGQGVALAPASLRRPEALVRCALRPALRMPDAYLAWQTDAPPSLRGFLRSARDAARTLWGASGSENDANGERRRTALADEPA